VATLVWIHHIHFDYIFFIISKEYTVYIISLLVKVVKIILPSLQMDAAVQQHRNTKFTECVRSNIKNFHSSI
jgi:hypothetical protein